jgi:prepilin-type N-terminal cleavage/methylation domain-containing protein
MSPRRRRGRAGGFTLLEVVIAMVLLALVAGICYAAFHLGTRAGIKGEEAVETAKRLRVAMDVLIRQVKSMVPQGAVGEDGDRSATFAFFSGTATSMDFVTEAGQLSGGGRARVRWEIESDPPRLRLTETPYFDAGSLGKGIDPEATSVIALDGFRAMRFEASQPSDDDPNRLDRVHSWNYEDKEALPHAILVHIEGLNGFDEDVDQWIPVMSAGRGDNETEPAEEQDCESETDDGTGSSGTRSGAGAGATPRSSAGAASSSNENDEDE